jgi:dissimilatory sulfite reductase flavoprotein subunit
MAIQRKKKKAMGKIRSTGSGSSSIESSPLRPKKVEKTPPCMTGCPQGTDIRGFMTAIQFGEKDEKPREESLRKAWDILVDKNPLPAICGRVCPHPCETECNRKDKEAPVGINRLERFIGDYGIEKGWALPNDAEQSYDEKVAVVGSGPAGLSCAYHLARRGYPVVMYEAFEKTGGMLRYGIPPYRLPHDVIDAEVQRILDLGVELKVDTVIGKDISLEDLKAQSAAVFVGIGAHVGKKLRVDGEDAPNVLAGTEFLRLANLGNAPDVGDKVLVIGGGDTAIDAARVSRRLGAEVTIVYRRTRAEMPAIDEEVVGAEEEGVAMHFLAQPVKLNLDGEKAVSMTCLQCELGEPDESGRRRPVQIEGSEFDIAATTIIAAISQEPAWDGFEEVKGGERWLNVDDGGHTPMPEVWAGGDVIDLALVTTAIAQGRLAADTIHRELRGEAASEPGAEKPIIRADKMILTFYEEQARSEAAEVAPENRFEDPNREIVATLDEDAAIAEAKRCMSCGMCFDCGTCWSYCQDGAIIKPIETGGEYAFKMDFCNGCKKCAEQCPCGFLEMH